MANKEFRVRHGLLIDGWYWFDSLEEACDHFGLKIEDYISDELNNQNHSI